jgi:ATP-dependent RNA helicase SUPV3L1/SUV3
VAGRVGPLPAQPPSARTLAAFGLRAVRGLAVPVEQLERLDELMRAAPKAGGGVLLSDQARDELGWSEREAGQILKGLGFVAARREPGQPVAWRRRTEKDFAVERAPRATAHSPFAALAALQPAAAPPARRPRRRRPRRRVGPAQP